MVYQWSAGYNYKASPEAAAKVMQKLADAGQLNASNLVKVSRPKNAPLHDDFEWDDTKAAESWRKQQGRCMINSLIIIPEEKDEKAESGPVRAFFKVKPLSHESVYESTQVLIKSRDGREALREQAAKELTSFRMKYNTILKWVGIEEEINDSIERLHGDAV